MANPIVVQSSNLALIIPTWCLVTATIAAIVYQVRETSVVEAPRLSPDFETTGSRRRIVQGVAGWLSLFGRV